MNALQRRLVNELQDGFPICERPYLAVAERLGVSEEAVIEALGELLDEGILSRFGPLFHAERLGGALTLAAMAIPEADFERVAAIVNGFPEVAHNYAREHALNMWFVLATERPEQKDQVLQAIVAGCGYPVYDLPKLAEYYVGLRLEATG